jgi:hypothetical protein
MTRCHTNACRHVILDWCAMFVLMGVILFSMCTRLGRGFPASASTHAAEPPPTSPI